MTSTGKTLYLVELGNKSLQGKIKYEGSREASIQHCCICALILLFQTGFDS